MTVFAWLLVVIGVLVVVVWPVAVCLVLNRRLRVAERHIAQLRSALRGWQFDEIRRLHVALDRAKHGPPEDSTADVRTMGGLRRPEPHA